MKTRSEIDEKFKWDLSCYIKDEKMVEGEFRYLESTYPDFRKFYKRLDNADMYYELLMLEEQFFKRADRLSSYIYHNLNTDTSNTYFINLSNRFEILMKKVGETCAFIDPQISKLKTSYLKSLIADKRFKDYVRNIKFLIKSKSHETNEKTSLLLSKMSMFLGCAGDAYDSLTTGEIEFKSFEVDGKNYQVSEAEYSKLLRNDNREVRKQTLDSLMNGYGKLNKTLTTLYANDVQHNIFNAKINKFNSVKESCLFYEEVDSSVYARLIQQVNKNVSILHEVMELKRKSLGLDKIAYYDAMMTLESEKHYSIEDAVELVKQATLPLGEEYQKLITKKFQEKCIDYLPNKNKETGAYSSGCYGQPSIILMNFVNDSRSVFTLAHEMGHTMHSELSNLTQPYATSDYKIFVAEVASTVNEVLLFNHLLKNADEKTKRALIFDLLDDFRATVFRQTMFSEFEDWVYSEFENDRPKNYDDLNDYYYNLNKKYYGDKVELPEELKYEWSRIPHFYRPFYVYKYATGFISALCIVEKLFTEKDYYKKYINFLKSGSSKPVLELLKDIGVDLSTDEPYKKAFAYIKEQMKKI